MGEKPSYEELEQRVNTLEGEASQRRQAEARAKRTEEEKRAILDSVLELVVHQDPDMNVLWANQTACNSVGVTREDLIGRRCYEVWAGRDKTCEDCPVAKARETGKPQTVEKMTSDGRWWYIQGYPVRDDSGDIVGMSELALDITERKRAEDALRKAHGELEMRVKERTAKLSRANVQLRREMVERRQAEEALRESEEKYRLLIESSNAAITFFDESGTYLYLNHVAAKWLGKEPEDFIGKSVHDTFAKRWANKFVTRFRRIVKSGVGETIEEEVKPLDRWLSSNLQPVRNQDGKIIGIQVIMYDISDRKQAEEALRQREAALQTRTRELEEVNNALRIVLKRMKEDRKDFEENVSLNVTGRVAPYAEKLKKTGLNAKQMGYLNVLVSNIDDITSPFAHRVSSKYFRLTPAEIQTACLVKDGKTTKQIAELLSVSPRTIESHRRSIRTKIGAKNRKANLRSLLLSIQER